MRLARTLPLAGLLLLDGCGVLDRGMLGAAGPVAEAERHLLYVVTIVMLFVIGPVLLITPLMAWHYRLSNTHAAYRPKWHFSWWIEGLIWVPPTLIVAGLAVVLWNATQHLDPYRPLAKGGEPLHVQAVALDWKWLFIYPDQGIATLNTLVLPAGRPVSIDLTSGTVMQSLLIPRLAGQIYAMAGMRTKLHLQADRPGTFIGENVQYNGEKFQAQKFTTTALPATDFSHWVDQVRQGGARFDASAYGQLFERSAPPPILYSGVPSGLFQRILGRYQAGAPDHPPATQESRR